LGIIAGEKQIIVDRWGQIDEGEQAGQADQSQNNKCDHFSGKGFVNARELLENSGKAFF
jgi:hypothetical protein